MENEFQQEPPQCSSGDCGFQILGEDLACSTTGTGCLTANFLVAEESAFYDRQMAEATLAIKEILGKIPEDPKGRKISFINTSRGVLLAWVDHSGVILNGAVTDQDDDEKIGTALKLKELS